MLKTAEYYNIKQRKLVYNNSIILTYIAFDFFIFCPDISQVAVRSVVR